MRGARWLLLVVMAAIVGAVGVTYRAQKKLLKQQAIPKPASLPAEIGTVAEQWEYRRAKDNDTLVEITARDFRQAKDAAQIASSIPPSVGGHYQEWISAAKGGKPAGSNFDWAGPLTESVLLGNVALRVQLREELTLHKLLWDSANLKFSNFDDANTYLRREYRAGWTL